MGNEETLNDNGDDAPVDIADEPEAYGNCEAVGDIQNHRMIQGWRVGGTLNVNTAVQYKRDKSDVGQSYYFVVQFKSDVDSINMYTGSAEEINSKVWKLTPPSWDMNNRRVFWQFLYKTQIGRKDDDQEWLYCLD